MEQDLIHLGSAIDNVYNYTSESGSRKTIAKIVNGCLNVSYMTIFNSSKENDLHVQVARLRKESDEMIKSRLKTIKKEFKECSGRDLVEKKISDNDKFETMTVSPYSPFRKLLFTCTYVYEVK
tara:strand:- start:960 stop:1328 length:369 start_codon:yes stop_codon:yes gene_type:complete